MLAEIIPKIAAMEAAEKEPSEFYPRPSLAGPERCIRQMVYWAMNAKQEKPGDRMWLVFDDSTWHETLTGDWIRKSAYRLHSEQMEVFWMDNSKGKIDGIITDLLGTDRLLEHKAINHFTFQKYWDGELPLDYICQCCLYCFGLQKVNPDITEILLLIKNKNTAQYLEFLIQYHFDMAVVVSCTLSTGETKRIDQLIYFPRAYCIARFAEVMLRASENNLPLRQYDMDHWRCEYCPYRTPCWKDYEDEFASLADNAEMEGEIVDLARYYLESSMHEKEMKKEKDELRNQIVSLLKEKEVRKGKAGEYGITLTLQKREYIDKEKIPAKLLASCTKESFSEVLRITKKKGGNDND